MIADETHCLIGNFKNQSHYPFDTYLKDDKVWKRNESLPSFRVENPQDVQMMNETSTQKIDDLEYDISHLYAFDAHPINTEEFKKDKESYLLKTATQNVQFLINKLFEVTPRERTEDGLFINLPGPKIILPREKPVSIF